LYDFYIAVKAMVGFDNQHHDHSGVTLGVLYIHHAEKPFHIARLLMESVEEQRTFVRKQRSLHYES
jgi:hypothetical protein